MANQIHNDPNGEIDLGQVSAKVKGYFTRVNDSFFDWIIFVKRNIIVISIIVIIGAALGFYMDSGPKLYSQKVIVHPNFESVDYLYEAVDEIEVKIKQHDTVFLKSIGIAHPKQIAKIEIEPVVDIYNFMNKTEGEQKEDRDRKLAIFELIAENGSMKDVLTDPITSKNYENHLITITSKDKAKQSQIVEPVMAYLNSNPYFKQKQDEYINNVNLKLVSNDSSIKQVDRVIDYLTDAGRKPSGSSVYYNETTDVADMMHFKNMLVVEQGKLRLSKTDYTDIIKERGVMLNEKSKNAVAGRMKFIIPVLFFMIFVIFAMLRSYYRSQTEKRKIVITE